MVVENVRGAQKWVGRARWNFGSFYLWGDVPALMPMVKAKAKVPTMGAGCYPKDHPKHVPGLAFNGHAERNLREDGKNICIGGGTHHKRNKNDPAAHWSGSSARKAASAMIAKIPLVLSRHIAQVYSPRTAA
jgi:hypothetical protein